MYTKEEQLKKVKKKKGFNIWEKKYFEKKSQNLSKDEKDFLNWLQTRENTVCFVCGKNDFYDKIEWHHVKNSSSDTKNHFRLIPLCGSKHHRNGELSPHGGARKFRETFSLESQLIYAAQIYQEYFIDNHYS